MCYLIAKNIDSVGCIALKTTHGKRLSDFKRKIEKVVGYEKIQLVTISRPSAYAEYEPYHFVETKEEFEYAVGLLNSPTLVNIAKMTDEEIHKKLQRGYADAEAGKVKKAAEVFAKFRKKIKSNLQRNY